MNGTQKGRISKRRAFQILGWAMIAWAVVDVGISLASLLGSESFRQALDMQNGTLALGIMLALIALNTAFYVMGGIAAIRLNYRLGMAYFRQGLYVDAATAFYAGCELAPTNKELSNMVGKRWGSEM